MKNGKITKRFLPALLSVCMTLTGITPVLAEGETERRELSGWTFDAQEEVDKIHIQSVNAKTLTEDGLLKIEGETFPYIFPFDDISIDIGKEYVVCFDAKAGETATTAVVVEGNGSFDNQYLSINTETLNHFEYQFTAKSAKAPHFALLNGGVCSAYYDNIHLYELVPKQDETIKNKVVKKWTFDSPDDINSFVVDPGEKAYENGMVKISRSGAYVYAYDGLSLTVGKDYIVSFKTKTAAPGTGGYLAVFGMYANGDIGFCNFDADGTEAVYSNRFTAHSVNVPYIVMVGDSAYIDDIYLYEATEPVSIVSSAPAAGEVVNPTDRIEIEFSDMLAAGALDVSSWTLTDGNGGTLPVSRVENTGSRYTLYLSQTTENLAHYTLSFEGLKSIYNQPMVTTSFEFVSYEGETLLYFPFSTGETSSWLYLQANMPVDMDKFFNTDQYHSAPGSRWVEGNAALELTVKKGDGTDSAPEFIAGEEYTVSFWAKPYIEGGQDASNVSLIRMNQSDMQFAGEWRFEGTDWQYFEATYKQKGTGGLRYQFVAKDSAAPIQLYLDDLKITRKTKLADFIVTGSNPQNGSTVGIVDGMTVNFSQTPGQSALDVSNYTLTGGTQTVAKAEIVGNSVELSFDRPLSANTAYTLSMNIKDVLGRDLAGENTVSFKTLAKVLYLNDLSTDADFQRPVFKEYAQKADGAALFDMSNGQSLYILQDNSYVNTPVEIGKSYTLMFKAATTAEGNAQHLALVESDESRFVHSIYDLSTEMKTYTVTFTPTTKAAPFFRMYTQDSTQKSKLLIDDIVLYEIPDELCLGEIGFYKDYGTDAQYQITDGTVTDGNISAVIESADNYTDGSKKLALYIALYEDGVLANVSMQEATLESGEGLSAALTAEIAVPQKTEGKNRTVKGFIWDADRNSPLDNAAVLED